MNRSLSIVLIVLIAFQTSLAGLVVCLDGGDCHVDDVAAHSEDACSGHSHTTFVNSFEPHSCDCLDHEIEGEDAVRGKREGLPTSALTLAFIIEPHVDYHRLSIAAPTVSPAVHSDAADFQRLAVVRATRLLI